MEDNAQKETVVVIGISSDIGAELARRYSSEGHLVVGTYRSTNKLDELKKLPNTRLFYCDIGNKTSIAEFIKSFNNVNIKWDTLISCPCNPLPLKPFFSGNFDEWSSSVHINAIEQLRMIHEMHPYRNSSRVSNIVFFATGGINNAVVNYSAYTISKIMLVKMCEYLDAENKDINIFIVGPGWTKTKTHELILKNLDHNDERYKKTLEFIQKGEGTSMDDIYGCIRWLCSQGKDVASGRNFSVVHDKWKGENGNLLSSELKSDPYMYKLRRHRNDFKGDKD